MFLPYIPQKKNISLFLVIDFEFARGVHRTDAVALLVSSGANVNKQNSGGDTPLHWAVANKYEDVVKVLLTSKEKNNLQVNQQNKLGWTALHFACRYGSKDVVELLLQQNGTDVKAETKQGCTPLHLASAHGHKEVVELLLQQNGIDANKVNEEGNTPLHLAVRKCMLCEVNEASMELQPCAHTVLCEDCSKTST
ncbi:E3 ubiquitin-protein ligase MIB2-like [Octopus sinensis]|uniref:E3 ubiquitin-protein ligase MIB2-like n=1 Tax=Octopus sinensis TaxID=2607531 RepID=A0A7E6FQI2_9MOLL|nr:E3 ubiquitin-protein ligase MIB2-like [Octopus sinensis]